MSYVQVDARSQTFDPPFRLNFTVVDLDARVDRLRTAGIAVERRPEWSTDYGSFARLEDPEGPPIEL